jgi:hypothetical protein
VERVTDDGTGAAVGGLRPRTDRVACTALVMLIITLALGGAAYALRAGLYYDETQYWQLGGSLLQTGVYSLDSGTPTAFKVPGVPVILAALQAAGLDLSASRVLFVLLLPLGACLAWRWLTAIGVPQTPAAWAVAFAFVNPALVVSSGTLYPQFGVGVAYLAAIAAWSACERSDNSRRRLVFALAAGLSLGVSMMLASTAIAVIAAMLLWALWRMRRGPAHWQASLGTQLATIGVVAVGVCLVVAPWYVRNGIAMGRFPLTSTSGGVTLLGGNSPASTVDNGPEMRFPPEDTPPAGLSEVERDDFYRERAIEHIRQQPIRYARLYIAKVAYGVWPTAVTATKGANRLGDVVQRLYYGLLYLGVLAWLLLKKRQASARSWIANVAPYLSLGVLMAAASLLSYAVFFTRLRYRLPTDIPLGLFAGLGAYLLWDEWAARLRRRRS